MHIGADAADPGKIEAFIYADYPFAVHAATWPESIFSSLVFALLFYTWERNPKDKRLTIPLLAIFIFTLAVAVLGLLFTPPA
jgi:MFS superfamily sulfate permease-like transporter